MIRIRNETIDHLRWRERRRERIDREEDREERCDTSKVCV